MLTSVLPTPRELLESDSRMLQKLGHRVDVAANGLEAVSALRRITYDLVFMDCQMPEMDGFGATRSIRAGEAGTPRHIPIVAMTAMPCTATASSVSRRAWTTTSRSR